MAEDGAGTGTDGGDAGGQGDQGQAYTPPASQADLDRIISDRLSRERAKFGDYDALKSKADRFDKLEDEKKSEAQRLAEERDREKQRGDSAEASNLKLQVALAKAPEGAKPAEVAALAARLTGSTKEELEADAEQLFALLGKNGRPAGDVGQGARGGEVPTSMSDLIRQRVAARG